ncbi:MAG TPA: potassium/proton antiporter [Micromonosporaceae bacterium]|jgi:cell volume regulation protein A|nr:potassium/proton antiporter [Micromonosporaceae bacterium]
MSLHQLHTVLLAGGLVLLASIAAARTASRVGLPALLVFLALGAILGEDGLGLEFDDAALAQALGTAALAVILVEGGLTTRWGDIRKRLAPAAVLSTVGVAISVVVTAVGASLILGIDWRLALLLGAIVSSTDAAAVFSILRAVPLPRRLAGLLEAESGLNDAPTVILVMLISVGGPTASNPFAAAGHIAYELVVGGLIGLGIGWLGTTVLRRVALPASGLYPLATVGLGIVAFAFAGTVDASGFLAAYLTGLVLGNTGLPHRAAVQSFAEGLGWLAQIGLFVMLGLLATPSQLPKAVVPALIVGLVLLLLARPLSVFVSVTPFRIRWREQIFLSWAGLRGAVPIVLATIPLVHNVPGSDGVFDIVFVLVAFYTLIQGPSLPVAARLLRLTTPGQAREVGVEAAPLDVLGAEMLTITVPPGSRLNGVEIFELRLPRAAVVTLVVRGEDAFVPAPSTRLKTDDELLIVTYDNTRETTEQRLRAIGRYGRIANWVTAGPAA